MQDKLPDVMVFARGSGDREIIVKWEKMTVKRKLGYWFIGVVKYECLNRVHQMQDFTVTLIMLYDG